jgi:hypothetical protein
MKGSQLTTQTTGKGKPFCEWSPPPPRVALLPQMVAQRQRQRYCSQRQTQRKSPKRRRLI